MPATTDPRRDDDTASQRRARGVFIGLFVFPLVCVVLLLVIQALTR